jgi:hypothetical protein
MRYGTASGNGSWAMYFGDASGIGSWAMYYSTASGLGSWAMSGGTATGDGSWATYGGTASGLGSWAMSGGTATGDGSWAMYGGTASGLGSWAMDNANATNDHSFAWRGGSHGAGTFNINPDGGVSGVWVGETNLAGIITGYGAAEAAIRAAADATNAAAVTAAAVAGTNYTDAAVNSEASIRAAADGTNAAQVAIALTNYQASADVNATGFVYAVSVAMTADVARAAAMTNALALAGHWRIIPYEYGGTPQASVGSIQLVNTNATSYANYPLPDRQDVGGATQATIRVIMGLNAASGQSNATAIATFDYVGQTDTTYPTIFSARDAVSRLHKTNTWTILLPAQSGSKLKIIRAAWPDTGASYIMGVSATFQSP